MAFDANNKRLEPGDSVTVDCDAIEVGDGVTLMATKMDHEGHFAQFWYPSDRVPLVTAKVICADDSGFGQNLLLDIDGVTIAVNSSTVAK